MVGYQTANTLILISTMATLLRAPALAQYYADRNVRTLYVNGEGAVAYTPNVADVQIAVDTTSKTAGASVRDNARLAAAVRKALADAHIADRDVQTASYSLNPVYDEFYGRQTHHSDPIGYETVSALKVTVRDLSKYGAILDAATTAGANKIDHVELRAANSVAESKLAIDAAVHNARVTAERTAMDAGVKISGVRTISLSRVWSDRPILDSSGGFGGGGYSPQASPGQLSVHAEVSVTYDTVKVTITVRRRSKRAATRSKVRSSASRNSVRPVARTK